MLGIMVLVLLSFASGEEQKQQQKGSSSCTDVGHAGWGGELSFFLKNSKIKINRIICTLATPTTGRTPRENKILFDE